MRQVWDSGDIVIQHEPNKSYVQVRASLFILQSSLFPADLSKVL